MVEKGSEEGVAVRLERRRGMLQCVSILPHGLQDELAVLRERCRGRLRNGPSQPLGLQDEKRGDKKRLSQMRRKWLRVQIK